MTRHILTLNAGSSSIKFALFGVDGGEPAAVAIGLAEMLGTERRIKVRDADGTPTHQDIWAGDAAPSFHAQALARVLDWRQVAFAVHPDRRPDDPSASLRFVRLKTGYERLRERSV